jgi:hypothetical protein
MDDRSSVRGILTWRESGYLVSKQAIDRTNPNPYHDAMSEEQGERENDGLII